MGQQIGERARTAATDWLLAETRALAYPWASGALSSDTRGRWCLITVVAPPLDLVALVSITFRRADGYAPNRPTFLTRGWRGGGRIVSCLAHVPADAVDFVVETLGRGAPVKPVQLSMRPVGRHRAALTMLLEQPATIWRLFLGAVQGDFSQMRRDLGALVPNGRGARPPNDYQLWIFACEPPLSAAAHDGPGARALIFGDPESPAFLATQQSLAGQEPPVPWLAAARDDLTAVSPGTYLILLQAGEILAAGAVASALWELRRLGEPGLAVSDYDHLDANGARQEPMPGPTPGHALMLSGTACRGAWFLRSDLVPAGLAASAGGQWAELARLAAWLTCYRMGRTEMTVRLPFFLTHRARETLSPPMETMTALVNDHLAGLDHTLRVRPADSFSGLLCFPEPRADGRGVPPVSIIIPSTLTAPHFAACMTALLARTHEVDIDIIVAVGQPGPLSDEQRRAAALVARDPRARVVHIPMARFNYSAVNNAAARMTDHPVLLLMNDDVAPIAPDWLTHLLAHLDDPAIGIVGPRLLYPSGAVQHGGVILGLSGMVDHASRGLPAAAPGHEAQVLVDQEMSAVTGACLLIRRAAFDAVGGLDEAYPSAFNDIDLCLRVGQAGWGTIYAGAVALTHHELQTYGSHYAGDRAPHREAELARFRHRWAGVVACDPYHNPNLSLIAGAEWDLAFPSRVPLWRDLEAPRLVRPGAPDAVRIPEPEMARGGTDRSAL